MKCYENLCENNVTTFCILEPVYACEEHAVGDYFWELPSNECSDECPSTMGGSCACEKEKVNG